MITEDYVSYEIAKLLNEKGFNGEFHKHYWGYEKGREFLTEGSFNPEYDYPAPTLQMAMKWLREEHNYHIMIDCLGSANWLPTIEHMTGSEDYKVEGQETKICGNGFDTYDEAVEAALKYCLTKLI